VKPEKLLDLYRDLQRYVAWTEEDACRIRSVMERVRPHFVSLVDDFYEEIQKHPHASKVITGGAAQVQRLKGTLCSWLEDLFAATCDNDYVLRRWKVGWRHVEIGLAQVYTNAAMSRLRAGLMRILAQTQAVEGPELALAAESLGKLIDLDLAIIEDAYQTEFLLRQDRIKRLATIGELAGGVAHELRNPLGIIRNAAYYLRMAQQDFSQDANDAFDEMERGLATSNRLVSELLDYVREPKREELRFPIGTAVTEALASIKIPFNVRLHLPPENGHVACLADRGQVIQIIDNLLRNAIEAMPHGGKLSLKIHSTADRVILEVVDSGVGIAATDLAKVFEPLFSRKTKGIGLGLAVSQRYAELNFGSLHVESALGNGATFRLILPSG